MSMEAPFFIGATEVSRRTPFAKLIEALRFAYAEGKEVPIRHHHHISNGDEPDATLLLMPAWDNARASRRLLGVKLVTVFPGNSAKGIPGLTSTYILYDGNTGEQIALLDGNAITARRTVAVSALGASYLARKDAKKLLVVGAGRVASLLAYAYKEVRAIEEVQVWDIDGDASGRLVDRLRADGFNARQAESLQIATGSADIVTSATLSTEPLIRGEWVREGTHVDQIGAFTPKMRESDSALIARASVYVDTAEALLEAGDLVIPMREGVFHRSDVRGDLQLLSKHNIEARKSRDEITYFKSVGSALADLTAASLAHSTEA